jgi:serpin B
VEIPYKGEGITLIVVLPEPGRFEAVESSWGVDLIKEIGQNLAPTDVKLYMPRFEYDASFSLAQTLADLGMPDAFDREKADFTGLIVHPTPRLFLKHVVHQASFAVDEMGTEAAAATAVVAEIVSEPVLVRVDRPFLFFIQDRANETILFMGRVLDPTG